MTELSAHQARLLRRLSATQRVTTAAGVLLALLGALYAGWGVLRFDPLATAAEHASFDAPVSALVTLYAPVFHVVDQVRPRTDVETVLLSSLRGNMNFSLGVYVTLMRVFLGALAFVMGLVMLTVVVERQRLLRIIDALRE
jgi:hypothetical protein